MGPRIPSAALLGIAFALAASVHAPASGAKPIRVEERLPVDGAELYLEVRGEDPGAPLLLWLHGGPGGAERPFFRHFNGALEERFVVAYWDQRGAGRSFDPDADPQALTVARHLTDLAAVVDHLRKRFARERVVLVGHSWGAALALLHARDHPEAVAAVVAVAPLVSTRAAARAEFDFVLDEAVHREDDDALAKLREIGAPPYESSAELLAVERLADRYGAVFHDPPSRAWLVLRGVLGGLVTPGEIPRMIRANEVSLAAMHDELQTLDLRESVPSLAVPVVFMLGRHDRHVDARIAAAWYETLRAPSKRLIWFERSAHNVPFEEPERFNEEVVAVLAVAAHPLRNSSERPPLLPSSDTMPDSDFNELLISALRALAARPLTNRKELAAWRVEADRFEESLTPEQSDAVPDFVWHYLADADIRLRNAGFRADQERRLERVFRKLGSRTQRLGPR